MNLSLSELLRSFNSVEFYFLMDQIRNYFPGFSSITILIFLFLFLLKPGIFLLPLLSERKISQFFLGSMEIGSVVSSIKLNAYLYKIPFQLDRIFVGILCL